MNEKQEGEYKRLNRELDDLDRKAKLADDLLPICKAFIRKVEAGRAHSTKTYGALKRVITAYEKEISKSNTVKCERLEEQKNGDK